MVASFVSANQYPRPRGTRGVPLFWSSIDVDDDCEFDERKTFPFLPAHNRCTTLTDPMDAEDSDTKDIQLDPHEPSTSCELAEVGSGSVENEIVVDVSDPHADAQASFSGCSDNLDVKSKEDKKKRVQQCLSELRHFVQRIHQTEINSSIDSMSPPKAIKLSTIETLSQVLDLLKNKFPKKQHDEDRNDSDESEMTLRYYSEFFADVTTEDRELFNHKSAITFELNQTDCSVLNVSWKFLSECLHWLDSPDIRSTCFLDFIFDESEVNTKQIVDYQSADLKCAFVKLKNPRHDQTVPSSSTSCKLFCNVATSTIDGSTRLYATVVPIATPLYQEIYSSSGTFYTKHSSDCRFVDIDHKVPLVWGYLPKEILGQCILSFLSEDSLSTFESSHEQVVKSRGKPIRTPSYAFSVRSGHFVTMQTEWSLFVNPWTKHVDFVIGCHSLTDGSFANGGTEPLHISSEKALMLQVKLTKLLSQPILRKPKKRMSIENMTKFNKIDEVSSKPNQRNKVEDNTLASKTNSPCRHMSTFFDRIVEHEYFMADAPPINEEFWKKVSPQGSLLTSVEGSSGSPPESSGSGPSYNEIARFDNVTRLLKSQEGHSSDDSNGEKRLKSSPSTSPLDIESDKHHIEQQNISQNGAIFEALCASGTPSAQQIMMMHRSQSAAADFDHQRAPNVKLTSEILQTFTKEQERQYKANWKRRFSVELQQAAKRALDPMMDNNNVGVSQKISRPDIYRPASIPVIARANEPFFYNPLTSPVSTWSNPAAVANQLPQQAKAANPVNYYRSLGPTPAPPPGKNFQITSAPLPLDALPAADISLNRQSAFAPLKKSFENGQFIVANENYNGPTSTCQQPINLSVRSDLPFQTSVIQSSYETTGSRSHWLNAPGASASVTLQRMTQFSRFGREPQWPSMPRSSTVSDELMQRYQCDGYSGAFPNEPSRLLTVAQQSLLTNPQTERIYNEAMSYNTTSDVSPIREATESLMLLEDI